MSLIEQLLSFGFVGGDRRLGVLVNFLRSQEIEQLEDLIGVLGFAGTGVFHDDDLLFVQKAVSVYACACI